MPEVEENDLPFLLSGIGIKIVCIISMNSELIPQSLSDPIERIKKFCIENGETIATAESVTSGAIQFMLSTAAEAQKIYQEALLFIIRRRKPFT
ncbi:CinA family protein [Niabella sp. W65]|nr:CinA family protein [Niabella sp. W65]MCH7364170.1 CinA family protein [Niabella sp. W65]ULT40047.1 CinA family protein [Niabella sp. I65]